MFLPNSYDDDILVDIPQLTDDGEDYYEVTHIPLKSLILRYRSVNNEICAVLFGDSNSIRNI